MKEVSNLQPPDKVVSLLSRLQDRPISQSGKPLTLLEHLKLPHLPLLDQLETPKHNPEHESSIHLGQLRFLKSSKQLSTLTDLEKSSSIKRSGTSSLLSAMHLEQSQGTVTLPFIAGLEKSTESTKSWPQPQKKGRHLTWHRPSNHHHQKSPL